VRFSPHTQVTWYGPDGQPTTPHYVKPSHRPGLGSVPLQTPTQIQRRFDDWAGDLRPYREAARKIRDEAQRDLRSVTVADVQSGRAASGLQRGDAFNRDAADLLRGATAILDAAMSYANVSHIGSSNTAQQGMRRIERLHKDVKDAVRRTNQLVTNYARRVASAEDRVVAQAADALDRAMRTAEYHAGQYGHSQALTIADSYGLTGQDRAALIEYGSQHARDFWHHRNGPDLVAAATDPAQVTAIVQSIMSGYKLPVPLELRDTADPVTGETKPASDVDPLADTTTVLTDEGEVVTVDGAGTVLASSSPTGLTVGRVLPYAIGTAALAGAVYFGLRGRR
jgi:hypothetical protein